MKELGEWLTALAVCAGFFGIGFMVADTRADYQAELAAARAAAEPPACVHMVLLASGFRVMAKDVTLVEFGK